MEDREMREMLEGYKGRKEVLERYEKEDEPFSDKEKILLSAIICLASFILMGLVQIPTPQYLNPAGACFATIWLASGIYSAMMALITWR